MWKEKSRPGIYGKAGLNGQIKRVDKAQTAALRLKWLMGARKYLRDPTIEKYFSLQEWRIGEILDGIDTALPHYPRAANFGVWQRRGLKSLWDQYMDQKFATAVSRTMHTMDTNLKELERRYVPGRRSNQPAHGTLEYVVMVTVKALSTEWRKEKRSKWEAPWVKKPIGPGGTFQQPEEVLPGPDFP